MWAGPLTFHLILKDWFTAGKTSSQRGALCEFHELLCFRALRKKGPPFEPACPVRFPYVWARKHICHVAVRTLLSQRTLCWKPTHPHLCQQPLNPSPAGKRPKLKSTSLIQEPHQFQNKRDDILCSFSRSLDKLSVWPVVFKPDFKISGAPLLQNLH